MEPTLVSLPPSVTPSGNWVVRSLIAIFRERRLPTRVARTLDRLLAGLGASTKTIRAGGLPMHVRRLSADVFFVREALVERQYNPPGFEIQPTDRIIDVGGNIGAFAVCAAVQAPRGRVVTLEPAAENFALLVRNLRLNRLRNVIPVPAAVLSDARPATLYLSPDGTGSHSIFADLAAAPHAAPHAVQPTDAVSLPELFERYELDVCQFLKLDCEGAEYEILYELPASYFPRIEKIALEYHARPNAPKRQQADGLVAHLQRVGYRIAGYTDVADTNRGMIFARRD